MSRELDKFLNRNIDEVIEWTKTLEDMIDQPHKYGYADSLLRSILEHIEQTGSISQKQKEAITNVKRKPKQPYGKRRRY